MFKGSSVIVDKKSFQRSFLLDLCLIKPEKRLIKCGGSIGENINSPETSAWSLFHFFPRMMKSQLQASKCGFCQ